MESITLVIRVYPNELVAAFGLLLLISFGYDKLVVSPVTRKMDGDHGIVAWLVVGGVFYTIAVFGVIAGIAPALFVLSMFIPSGIPMITGSYGRNK